MKSSAVPYKPFRYFGSKTRLLSFYRHPPEHARRIIEPYLGSGAYLMNETLPGVGYEAAENVYAMWKFLQSASEHDLHDLSARVESAKKERHHYDARDLHLPLGMETYVRVNVCGIATGQLSSYGIYDQHRLPIAQTIQCLPRMRDIEIIHGSGELHQEQEGDMFFIDPPYVNTIAHYGKSRGSVEYNPETTRICIQKITAPTIVTYGNTTTFPELPWEFVKTKHVPNMRSGGTISRDEWVAYLHWNTAGSRMQE